MPYRVGWDGDTPFEVALDRLGSPELVAARHALMKAVYEGRQTGVTPREREAIRFPLTVVVGCATCNSLRMWRDWPGFSDEPIDEEFYANAAIRNLGWRGFSDRERLLIEFVQRLEEEIGLLNGDDQFWARMHAHFTDLEIGDVSIMAANWLGVGRLMRALGVGSICAAPIGQASTGGNPAFEAVPQSAE